MPWAPLEGPPGCPDAVVSLIEATVFLEAGWSAADKEAGRNMKRTAAFGLA